MRLRLFQMFCEVVRTGGFSSAARATFATQSAVSKAVKQLEDGIGMPLLERGTHPLRLTAAGQVVYRHAQALLAQEQQMQQELSALQGLQRGELRLGLPPLGSASLFAPLFAVYRQRYPQIDIQLQEHGSRRLEELLLKGDIELGATLLPVADNFEVLPVCKEPLLAVLPADHPLAQLTEITLSQLRDTPFIFFEAGFALNHQLRQASESQGFEPIEGARSGQIDFIVALVAAGQGVAFLPRLMVPQLVQRQVRYVPLATAPGTDWDLALVWRRGGQLSVAAQAWLALTRERMPARP